MAKITKEQIDFIKTHQGALRSIIEEVVQEYFNKVVDEPDSHRKEVLSLMVKELRRAQTVINNLANLKEKKKGEKDFTGV